MKHVKHHVYTALVLLLVIKLDILEGDRA